MGPAAIDARRLKSRADFAAECDYFATIARASCCMFVRGRHVIWRAYALAGENSHRDLANRIACREGLNMVSFAHSMRDDDTCISEQLIGRLHHASEDSILDLVSTLRASERANLAMHCYRKSHLRQIGLTIATTCDLNALVHELGPVLGGAIFAQSRKG